MHILVAGVRHQTAPIEVREQLALSEGEIKEAIPALIALPGIAECVVLSTCNRTEIYAAVTDTTKALASIQQFFLDFKGFNWSTNRRSTFLFLHEDAVYHLFRVAAGVDSLIIGEGQILGQVKDALTVSLQLKSSGTLLDKLFKTALSVGKRIRTETGIASRDISVSRAALDFAKSLDPDLFNEQIAILGGGKVAEILLKSIKEEMAPTQWKNLTLVNRNEGRLNTLTQQFGFPGVLWDQLPGVLNRVDVIFVATGAPHLVLDSDDFQDIVSPKLLIDISVPRNVDPQLAELPLIRLFNTDNLGEEHNQEAAETTEALKAIAEDIIREEYAGFHQWLIGLPARPTITRIRAKVENIRQAQMETAQGETAQSESLDTFSRQLVNKILHELTVRLKTIGKSQLEIQQQAALLSQLFDVHETSESA
jgi:glutamyl-tRNA reductase